MQDDGYFGNSNFEFLGPHFLEFDSLMQIMIADNSGSPVPDENNNVMGVTNLDSDNGEVFIW
ncbi:hypothetical protein [Enterococcus faecium]|uniref:hypothetical protein n=1 Tax=Enterococcus faecium TaxID=1352 RepID=UPI000BF24A5D|nr:hypothetical protein [Enterococcus faecium]PEH49542.1 hypothetical protein CRM75_01945 [Enterococcus faecium]